MKKNIYILLIIILIIIIQQAIISRIRIFGVGIDIVFIFIICYSLLSNEIESIIVALVFGIIRDCFFPFIFGINSVIYIITAYLLTLVQKRIFRDSLIIPAFFTFVFTMFKIIIYYSYFYIASIKFNFKTYVYEVLLLESFYSSIFSLIMYKYIKNFCSRFIVQNDWKF